MNAYYFWVDSATVGGFLIAAAVVSLIISFIIWTRGRDN